jgi:hypothetical protein
MTTQPTRVTESVYLQLGRAMADVINAAPTYAEARMAHQLSIEIMARLVRVRHYSRLLEPAVQS